MDNSFIIDNLLQQQESVRLEFKAKPEKAAIAKVITSFINTQGGDLIIGINDDKSVVGVVNAEKVQQSIKKLLIESITPNAPISIQIIRYKRKDVILISVWEGAKKPYQFRGKIFTRENNATKVSNQEILNHLIKERKESDFHWERRAVLGADIKDLDLEEMKRMSAQMSANGRLPFEFLFKIFSIDSLKELEHVVAEQEQKMQEIAQLNQQSGIEAQAQAEQQKIQVQPLHRFLWQ